MEEWCSRCQKYVSVIQQTFTQEKERVTNVDCSECHQFLFSINERDASVSTLVFDEINHQIVLVKNEGGWKELSPGEGFDKPSGWGLPTGRKKPGESERNAAERETEEETGGLIVEIDPDPRLKVEDPRENHTKIAFIGYPITGKIGTPRDENVLEARWFPVRVLWIEDKNDKDFVDMYPWHRRAAQELLQRRKGVRKQN